MSRYKYITYVTMDLQTHGSSFRFPRALCGMSTVLVLSGISTMETLKTYAYRPNIVLNGVGDIVKLAQSADNKETAREFK